MDIRPMQECSIKAVIFDFGGVLAEEGFREGLLSIARHNHLQPEHFLEKVFALAFEGGFVTGRTDEKMFWQSLREQTGISGSDQELRGEVLSRFTLRTWMLDLVRQLKNASRTLAILSDQTTWLDELNTRYRFFSLFDYVFNSYYLGKTKQDPSIFKDVLEALQTNPRQSLFIDDNIDNVERARQQGLHTIHYRDREAFERELSSFCPFRSFI